MRDAAQEVRGRGRNSRRPDVRALSSIVPLFVRLTVYVRVALRGLGKTLQTVALIWTLLKQTPYIGPHSQSVIGKALIVCPVSLTSNWKKEFNKWCIVVSSWPVRFDGLELTGLIAFRLGRDAIGVFVGDGDKNHIRQFTTSRRHQVLVIGYEKVRMAAKRSFSIEEPMLTLFALSFARSSTSSKAASLRSGSLSATRVSSELVSPRDRYEVGRGGGQISDDLSARSPPQVQRRQNEQDV